MCVARNVLLGLAVVLVIRCAFCSSWPIIMNYSNLTSAACVEQSQSMLRIFAPPHPFFSPAPTAPCFRMWWLCIRSTRYDCIAIFKLYWSFWPPIPPRDWAQKVDSIATAEQEILYPLRNPRNFTNKFEVPRVRSQQPVIGPYHDPFPSSSSTFSNTFSLRYNLISHIYALLTKVFSFC